jgi:hypothetical protein
LSPCAEASETRARSRSWLLPWSCLGSDEAVFLSTRRQEFTFVYAAEIESGELKIDDQSKQAAWVPLSSAVELPLAESQRRRLKDVVEYQKERRTFLR